jgi:N-acetylmuramoyl-L-alanine amidase
VKWFSRYTVTKNYLTAPSKRRSGILMPSVQFIVAHDTGNPGSTARANVSYYENSRDQMSASAHLFVDDKEIIECVPALTGPAEKAWHVVYDTPIDNSIFGDDANDIAIGVELCFGGRINMAEAYKRYVYTLAAICHRFDLNPITKITGHYIIDPKRKIDPQNSLKMIGKNLVDLKKDVEAELKFCRLKG